MTQPFKTIDCEAPVEDATLFIAPFFDGGYVWNHLDNPNGFTGQRFLASIGLGIGFEAKLSPQGNHPVISVRLDYGYPLVSSNTRGNDFQDAGVHLSIRYRF